MPPHRLKALAAALLLSTQGVAQVSPNFDFGNLGQVALTGDFDAISVYSFPGQFNNNGSTALLSHMSEGAYEILAATDASIDAMCPFVLKDGTFAGIIAAGNFSSLGGVASRSIALFDPSTRAVTALPGIQGTVNAVFCDQSRETVYVGGSFEAANSSNAIIWVGTSGWANLPFAGFDAPVSSITRAPNGHIVFAGSFSGLGNTTTTRNTGDTANQAINLGSATLTSGATGSGQPSNVICAGQDTQPWLLRDNTPGFLRADFRFGFEPQRLVLRNPGGGRGTKTFRYTAFPLGGIMNLTYEDNGRRIACDARCEMPETGEREFTFVNTVGMNSFRLDISDWYGQGGGFSSVQLFQSDIFAYAVPEFNEPTCNNASRIVSTVTNTGPWTVTPSQDSVADYLTAVVGPADVDTANIVFRPDIQEGGNYSVIVFTPGCLQDSSCSSRGIVNVTGTLASSAGPSFTTQIFQNNNFDKYDQVFQGRIDETTGSFRPEITLTASGLTQDQRLVASRIKFGLISSTGGLNGVFDYDPNRAVVDPDFSQSSINQAGSDLGSDAEVNALVVDGDTLYMGGRFSTDNLQNILAFVDDGINSLQDGGLNAPVRSMASLEGFLYVGGNFSATVSGGVQGLNNVAAYEFSSKSWVALGSGLNGPVDAVVPVVMNGTNGEETMMSFNGRFTEIAADPTITVDGLAVWVPSTKQWLQQTSGSQQLLAGQLTAATLTPNNTWIGAGDLQSLGQAISGAARLVENNGQVVLRQTPANFASSRPASSIAKRALLDHNATGVVTGAWYNPDSTNVTIFAGSFSISTTDDNTVENLVFINGSNNDAITGLPAGLTSNSTFHALVVFEDTLVAAGSVSGQVGDATVSGILLYDLAASRYDPIQPAGLLGDSVVVHALAMEPDTTTVYVGGSFDRTSQDLACPAVCMYDLETDQWNPVGSGLDGEVTNLFWTKDKKLLASGNLTLSGNRTTLALYDPKEQTWAMGSFTGATIPGTITAFAGVTDDAKDMWVAGTAPDDSAFLIHFKDGEATAVNDVLDSGSRIESLQMIPLTKNHGNSDGLLPNDKSLLVTGQLNVTGYGISSAAVFNGTTMTPLILASFSDGRPGSVSRLVSSKPIKPEGNKKGRATGIVVLVALCAALGTIFLIVLIGILLNRIQRRRQGYNSVPTNVPYADKNTNIQRVPPDRLLGSLGPGARGVPRV